MNLLAIQKLRKQLAAQQPTYGLWITLESPSITEMAVALGLDWVVIDAEHGHLDWKEIVEHVRAAARSGTVVLVRVTELNGGLIKRALDIGADGVIVPWIETAAQLEQAVKMALYPLEGVRGIGAERATAWGQCLVQHTAEANEQVLIVPLIETVTAAQNIEALCQVPHVDCFFLGPADFTSTAGYRGQWGAPQVAAELRRVVETLRRHGKHCGVVAAGPEDLVDRKQQGFAMLAVGIDAGLLLRSLHGLLGVAGRDRKLDASLLPVAPLLPSVPLPGPPASLRPDRPEIMHRVGEGTWIELAPGVAFEAHVGEHNQARDLTTGTVLFQAGAQLPCHQHPCSESITVLSGEVVVAVEGREYRLGSLDNLVVPRHIPHAVRNGSPGNPATVHVALGSAPPIRTLVGTSFPIEPMPMESPGRPGKERVTRAVSAPRFAAGPGTAFVDHFNASLMPGIEMSGGYALFQPGGRLPAHVHYFDESISIVQGDATCVVEGRRYQMTSGSTALQPRGRVHYFINESAQPMAMIWVYAGPVPDRVAVAEWCATAQGNPWAETGAAS